MSVYQDATAVHHEEYEYGEIHQMQDDDDGDDDGPSIWLIPRKGSDTPRTRTSQSGSCRLTGYRLLLPLMLSPLLLVAVLLLTGQEGISSLLSRVEEVNNNFGGAHSSKSFMRGNHPDRDNGYHQQQIAWHPMPNEAAYKDCVQEIRDTIDEKDLDWDNKKKRLLPDFKPKGKNGGGVIVFWHLAKTGGTTVRKQCATLPGVDYMMLVSREEYEGGAMAIEQRLTPSKSNNDTDKFHHSHSHTLFVELHGLHSLTVLDMEQNFRRWRSLSEENGTPLFIFTLLREPVAYSLSYFNFFHKSLPMQPTQHELLVTSFNRQCHTLGAAPGQTVETCAELYKKLYQLFDWVGTTESMTDETLPLLQYLLRHKKPQERFAVNATSSWILPSDPNRDHYNVAKPYPFSLQMEQLSDETIRVLNDKTCLDRGLWEQVKEDYTLNMWKDEIEGRP